MQDHGAWRVTAWGWEAAALSLVPLWLMVREPSFDAETLALIAVVPGNLAFIAAAILLPLGKPRSALACAIAALGSMVYGGYVVPARQNELGFPAGHLGPGYYAWLFAGALMAWASWRALRLK